MEVPEVPNELARKLLDAGKGIGQVEGVSRVERIAWRTHGLAMGLLSLLAARPTARADALAGIGGDVLEIRADQIEVDVPGGTAVLTGNVSLVKGALRVACPRIDVKYDDAPRITWAKGSGGVTADIRGVHAEAPEVEIDLAKHVIDLSGGVRLKRGQGWLNADHASIETQTAKVTLQFVRGALPVALPKP